MNRRWIAAVHEAGHAVAGMLLGGKLKELNIHERQRRRGRCFVDFWHGVEADAEGMADLPLVDVIQRWQKEIITHLAGGHAEHAEFPHVPLWKIDGGAEGDLGNADALARRLVALAGGTAEQHLHYLKLAAQELVSKHREPIKRVADALFAKGELTAEEAEKAMGPVAFAFMLPLPAHLGAQEKKPS